MSQFDFPRINFHGSVLLDTPTANNGKTAPLMIYNQNEAQTYLPPRVYLNPNQVIYVQTNFPAFSILTDSSNNSSYVQVDPINNMDIFQQWATTILGNFAADADYLPLYNYCGVELIAPGYWNYYGDLSMSLQNVLVTGVQLPDDSGRVNTWTAENKNNCPAILSDVLGASLSFNQDFFDPASRSTSVLCDVDSEGQTCTQIFYGNAGIYSNSNNEQKTFLTGKPCKSTTNWLNVSKVLNWSDGFLMPMGGSACFYSTIQLDTANCDSDLLALFSQYAGQPVTALFMKYIIHQVHEVRYPDYSKMPTVPLGSNRTDVPKNPAHVAITGSICAWVNGDMMTTSVGRILKNSGNAAIDPANIPVPVPAGPHPPTITVPISVALAPAFLKFNQQRNLLSIDVINTISEYGTVFGTLPVYAGNGDVRYFDKFENYNFGEFELWFRKDQSVIANKISSFNFDNDYSMSNYLAKGGMIDLTPLVTEDFSQGVFYLTLNNEQVLLEDEVLICTDQQGTYAEQNQVPVNLYMNDGLPRIPVTLRAFYRGKAIPQEEAIPVVMQTISMSSNTVSNSSFSVYDGVPFSYPVNSDGCTMYGFSFSKRDLLSPDFSNIVDYLLASYFITTRVLSAEPQLNEYLNKTKPLTWDVVYENIFENYQAVLPIMNVVVPFNEANWSSPFFLSRMLMVIDEKYWNAYMYMPVTRELSATQRQLLQMWAQQCTEA